ncbi:cytidyltransferase [Pedobacter quisquiliarum]|uniref:Cytidyltransferase n=1 Tax=Pedobacter quisquiliarum TaxID=1834438 RepID=A0A916U8G9_9SPHI|nr:adenylyltransferase/cytidyltransferase family protein [Pedobacter quisquiliarum]GGC64521.1 cytidyltransferase [Pedobacter quisquiliarum]
MKRIIGYTTGVFDLFHIGHLNILKRAKSQCDELIVGITTDELCMKLKNKVPVISFDERCSIVESIRVVDRVVAQDRIDELADHELYSFDRIFKGSDWEGSPKWTALEKEFSKKGVEVIYFEYTASTSSTLVRSVLEQKTSA